VTETRKGQLVIGACMLGVAAMVGIPAIVSYAGVEPTTIHQPTSQVASNYPPKVVIKWGDVYGVQTITAPAGTRVRLRAYVSDRDKDYCQQQWFQPVGRDVNVRGLYDAIIEFDLPTGGCVVGVIGWDLHGGSNQSLVSIVEAAE